MGALTYEKSLEPGQVESFEQPFRDFDRAFVRFVNDGQIGRLKPAQGATDLEGYHPTQDSSNVQDGKRDTCIHSFWGGEPSTFMGRTFPAIVFDEEIGATSCVASWQYPAQIPKQFVVECSAQPGGRPWYTAGFHNTTDADRESGEIITVVKLDENVKGRWWRIRWTEARQYAYIALSDFYLTGRQTGESVIRLAGVEKDIRVMDYNGDMVIQNLLDKRINVQVELVDRS